MTDNSTAAPEQGSYELIKRRLGNFGIELHRSLETINQNRIDTFGSTELKVQGRVRVRTEHNCIPRDMVIVGDKLIFAYNVFIGLKQTTQVSDVFSVHKLVQQDDHYEVESYPEQTRFLTDERFLRDFEELYTYYKQTRLQHLFQQNGKLFALFQIGDKLTDVRVFRWQIDNENFINYIDNRGERDIQNAGDFDFEWIKTDRKDHVEGKHPHINLADRVFVETLKGQLTIKIENNTESGAGIYQEPVEDSNQSLADCQVEYAQVGDLTLFKVLPYREQQWRFFIYNNQTQAVIRQDALGQACVQLPEDHGLIFPGGYYLMSGQTRYFEDQSSQLDFHQQIKSPNGEDVLYVFYEPGEGRYALFAYNLIEKQLQNPIYCHGYGLFEDGKALTFKADSDTAERVHPIQIWQSPFVSSEFAANTPAPSSLYGKIGNPDLVRGLSDLYSLCKSINEQTPSVIHYEALIALNRNIFDRYHWLTESDFDTVNGLLHQIAETAEQVLDEFEKVSQIQQKAADALEKTQQDYQALQRTIRPDSFKLASEFVEGLQSLKILKGQTVSLEETKYMDLAARQGLQDEVDKQISELSQFTASFLQKDDALAPYNDKLQEIAETAQQSDRVTELKQSLAALDEISTQLDLLNHTMLDLEIDDSQIRTQILEQISEVYAQVNRTRAEIEIRRKSLGSKESKAEFAARFKLFGQSVTHALSNAETPQQCDEHLSRLLIQLEELESQFSEHDEFLSEIVEKRDQVFEHFEAHKQQLLDTQQRRALNLASAAERILQGVERRSQQFTELDELNTYFVSDPMITKLRGLCSELRELGDEIRADDIQAKLKASKDQGVRSLRDKQDLYSDGGTSVKIGKHSFSVNNQLLDLTLLPKDDQLMLHLTGTNYFESVSNPEHLALLENSKHLWQQNLISENDNIYRAEYLAAQLLREAENEESQVNLTKLNQALNESEPDKALLKLVHLFIETRYQEGYEKGIHDLDAVAILKRLLEQKRTLKLLIYPAGSRALAQLYSATLTPESITRYRALAKNASLMHSNLNNGQYKNELIQVLSEDITAFSNTAEKWCLQAKNGSPILAAQYLVDELAAQNNDVLCFSTSQAGRNLAEQFISDSKSKGYQVELEHALAAVPEIQEQALLILSWIKSYAQNQTESDLSTQIEAANYVHLKKFEHLDFKALDMTVSNQVDNLLGQHPLIQEQALSVEFAEFYSRTQDYIAEHVPAFKRYAQVKNEILQQQKQILQLDEFQAKPLSSFVRNQLIDKVYFPIIGDNLAKQIGASGKNKRSDLMGMLLLISPPGYGKTTLIEYVANRLGLTFVKVNCPSIGHDQVSLDPAQAINATAEKEIAKINQSFEMGNNVMLYLDDIQHTNPEFLQKFISLCDGSRRIDGVWNGQSKTYDLRGKKFAVVMAGNPYTESGEAFKIPDMLANRADIYNLGDTLSGCEQEFAMSFIENALTSNSVLAPLATRDMQDLYKLIRMAEGEEIALTELTHGYSQAETNEILAVLDKLMIIRDTVLKVNAQYIASAAQDDKYRIEPPFKLQGSYRNMNKMAEKVVPAMNESELESLVQDHYRGEAQTLTKGSEENLLKLAELRETLDEASAQRWAQIKSDYVKLNKIDTSGSPAMLAVEQLSKMNSGIDTLSEKLTAANLSTDYSPLLENMGQTLASQNTQQGLTHIVSALDSMKSELETLNQVVADNGLKESMSELNQCIERNSSRSQLQSLTETLSESHVKSELKELNDNMVNALHQLKAEEKLTAISHSIQEKEWSLQPNISVENTPDIRIGEAVSAIAETLETSLLPVLKIMQHKIRLDHDVWNKVDAIAKHLKAVNQNFEEPGSPLNGDDKDILG